MRTPKFLRREIEHELDALDALHLDIEPPVAILEFHIVADTVALTVAQECPAFSAEGYRGKLHGPKLSESVALRVGGAPQRQLAVDGFQRVAHIVVVGRTRCWTTQRPLRKGVGNVDPW